MDTFTASGLIYDISHSPPGAGHVHASAAALPQSGLAEPERVLRDGTVDALLVSAPIQDAQAGSFLLLTSSCPSSTCIRASYPALAAYTAAVIARARGARTLACVAVDMAAWKRLLAMYPESAASGEQPPSQPTSVTPP